MLFIWSINDIFYGKYPRFSRLMIVMFLLYIAFADLNQILLHIIAVILFIIIINNPKLKPYYDLIMDEYLLAKTHADYMEPLVYTKRMFDYIKMS